MTRRLRRDVSPYVRVWNLESWVLESGFRNTVQGLRNPINDWNPESKFYRQRNRNPVSGVRNARREIQNPRLSWIPLHGARRTETSGRDAIRNFNDADGNKNVKKKTNKQTNNRFNKQNNFARALPFFTFLCLLCTTTTRKCLISCFMERVNKQRRNFVFLSALGYT